MIPPYHLDVTELSSDDQSFVLAVVALISFSLALWGIACFIPDPTPPVKYEERIP